MSGKLIINSLYSLRPRGQSYITTVSRPPSFFPSYLHRGRLVSSYLHTYPELVLSIAIPSKCCINQTFLRGSETSRNLLHGRQRSLILQPYHIFENTLPCTKYWT